MINNDQSTLFIIILMRRKLRITNRITIKIFKTIMVSCQMIFLNNSLPLSIGKVNNDVGE